MLHGQRHAGAQILMNQKVSRYRQSLSQWAHSVQAARNPHDAFRLASNKPSPSSLIRSMHSLYSSDAMRAQNTVERNLSDRLDKIGGDDPIILNLMRMSQGHWPRLYRKIENMRRQAREEAEGKPDA